MKNPLLLITMLACFAMNAQDNARDIDFAREAAINTLTELKLAELAIDKTDSEKVKELAEQVLLDRAKTTGELETIAETKNIELPGDIDSKTLNRIKKLEEKQGAEFDKEYIDVVIKNHTQLIDKFSSEAEEGKDPELREWAARHIPSMKHHLHMAEDIYTDMKKK